MAEWITTSLQWELVDTPRTQGFTFIVTMDLNWKDPDPVPVGNQEIGIRQLPRADNVILQIIQISRLSPQLIL